MDNEIKIKAHYITRATVAEIIPQIKNLDSQFFFVWNADK